MYQLFIWDLKNYNHGADISYRRSQKKRLMDSYYSGPRNQLEKLAAIHNKNANSPGRKYNLNLNNKL